MIHKAQHLLPAFYALCLVGGAASGCTSDSASGVKATGNSSDAGHTRDASGGAHDAGGTVAKCGNGKVESGERCDTAIAAGSAGACPDVTVCDDKDPCTTDAVSGVGTCAAECAPPVPVAANLGATDSCCPSGATFAIDVDCNPNCGNGKLDTGEKCDPAIKAGAGVCQTTCPDDGNPCTIEKLVAADPCNPSCSTTTITTAKDGDKCCPKGASAANDKDCTAVCGNGKVEPGEDCDDATPQCKNCTFVPTAFRLTSLILVDPHAALTNGSGDASTCSDVTAVLNGYIAGKLTEQIKGPDSGVGNVALSFVLVERPNDQKAAAGKGDFFQSDCAYATPVTSCAANPTLPATVSNYKNQTSGTCLAPDPKNINAKYTTPIVSSTAGTNGCFVSDPTTVTLHLGAIDLTFQSAQISAQYAGDPATGLVQGLFIGFLTEASIKSILLPPALGNFPFASAFPTTNGGGCYDDRDLGPDGTTRGWYWHLNFEAKKVDWTSP